MRPLPFKRRVLRFFQIYVILFLGRQLMRLLLKTCSITLYGMEEFYKTSLESPTILMLWHNRIVLGPNFFGDFCPKISYTAFVSNSRDGDWLALATEWYPNGHTIRVPKATRHEALRSFIKAVKKGTVLLVTPDGPMGPKYKIKPGTYFAAKRAHAKVLPFSWSASKYWRIPSWDGTLIPKPFSKIAIGFGEPLTPLESLSDEEGCLLLEKSLHSFKDFLSQKLH